MTTLAEDLARYAHRLEYEDLPAEVVREVKRRMIDSIGCALGAWHAEPCEAARRVAIRFAARDGATLLGTRHRVPPDWAAFANGCLVRYLDYNDTYLSKEPAHPSDNIAALLAVAEAGPADARELITAIALAYEVQCRLCDAASLRARGWDHVTYGVFSTALAAARLLRLSPRQTVHALGIAGVASAALRQARVGELSHWKACAFAGAARQGVFAALLAQAGITGPAPIFEGEKGFEILVSGKLDLDVERWGGKDASDYMILRSSIKFWPAEYHAQSAIEAALNLRTWTPDPRWVKAVLVESHDAAVDIIGSEPEKWHPASRETADHSLPYLVAAALMDGEITPRQFRPERLADPALLALTQLVHVERHAELSRLYPAAVGNIVTVTLQDGGHRSERVDYPRGHARRPLTDAELETKFHSLADPAVGHERATELLRRVWKLEEARDFQPLWELTEIRNNHGRAI